MSDAFRAGGVRAVLGVASHELAISVRTPGLWVAPALWLALTLSATRGAPAGGLSEDAGLVYFVGLLAAILAVTLPGRTRAAGAEDLVGSLPAARTLATGRVLAALGMATALVLVLPPIALAYAALRGSPLAGWAGGVALYLGLLLPAAWVAVGLGAIAGSVLRDGRVALLVVFLGGVAAFFLQGVNTVFTPAGLLDPEFGAVRGQSAFASVWPLGRLLPWHVLALLGCGALLAVAAAGLRRTRTGLVATVAALACVVAAAIGYQRSISRFAVGPSPTPDLGEWQVQRMAVTVHVGTAATATADMVLRNATGAALQTVALHLTRGLDVLAAHEADPVRTLPPGPTLRLPQPVPANGTVELNVTYGGRWTLFLSHSPLSLTRAVAPSHVVLDLGDWLPRMTTAPVPLTVQLTGDVPPVTFCDLTPTGADAWSGESLLPGPTCVGGALRRVTAGAAEVWTWGPAPAAAVAARQLDRADAALSACLGVAPVPVGVVTIPAAASTGGWAYRFALRRYDDPAVAGMIPGFDLDGGGLTWAWQASPGVWGHASAAPGSLAWAMSGLLPIAAARQAGITPPMPPFVGRTPAAWGAAWHAVDSLPPAQACALMRSLHTLDVRGRLSLASVTQAVARAEGGTG